MISIDKSFFEGMPAKKLGKRVKRTRLSIVKDEKIKQKEIRKQEIKKVIIGEYQQALSQSQHSQSTMDNTMTRSRIEFSI